MEKKNTDTSLRVDKKTRENLEVLSQRDDVTIKKLVFLMTVFFIKNRIGVEDDFVSFDKIADRIIRILKAHERDLLSPIFLMLNKMNVFQNQLISEAEIRAEGVGDEERNESEIVPIQTPILERSEGGNLDKEKIEKLQISNDLLLRKLAEITGEDKVTFKTGLGSNFHIIKLSVQEFEDIKKTIEVCTIR